MFAVSMPPSIIHAYSYADPHLEPWSAGHEWRPTRKRAPTAGSISWLLATYILLSLALSWPLPARLGRDVAGRYVDARVFQWNNWWVKTAIREGLDLDATRHIYAPSGVSLVSHNFNWVSSFLSLPLDWLFGPLVAYNLLFLLTIWLSGFAMYLLALHLTERRDAAFLAGLVFAFFPYHLSGNWDGQMNLANAQWLPLSVLFLVRTVEHKRISDALLAGLFLALAGLDCWFFLIFMGMWGVVWLAYSAVANRKAWSWRLVGLLLLSGAVGVALMSPFLLPVIAETTGRSVEAAVAYHAEDKASDLLAFIVPSSDHPLLGAWVRPIYGRFRHWRPASLGFVALLLALYAVVARFRRSFLWALTGLLFAGLALGTTLTVTECPIPPCRRPTACSPISCRRSSIVRQANRFNVMVGLSLAALVGIGWAGLGERLSAFARSRSWDPRDDCRRRRPDLCSNTWPYPAPFSPARSRPFIVRSGTRALPRPKNRRASSSSCRSTTFTRATRSTRRRCTALNWSMATWRACRPARCPTSAGSP